MLGPREWFGEMGPIDVMPRSATLRAIAEIARAERFVGLAPEQVDGFLRGVVDPLLAGSNDEAPAELRV